MRRLETFGAAALIVVAIVCGPLRAQTDPAGTSNNATGNGVAEINDQAARWNALAQMYNAQAAASTAQAAATNAQLAPLQRLAGSGNVQIDNGSADFEAASLTAVSIGVAAQLIAADVTPRITDGKSALLLQSSDTFSFDDLDNFLAQGGELERQAQALLGTSHTGPAPRFVLPIGAIATILGSVASLVQSDVHLQSVDLTSTAESQIIGGIARNGPGKFVLPAQLIDVRPSGTDDVTTLIGNLSESRGQLADLIAHPATPANPLSAGYQPLFDRINAFLNTATTRGQDGVMPIRAIYREQQLRSATSAYFLRIRAERAGGVFVTRKNLLTAFGAPNFTISGGVIASYLLVERTTGNVIAGGSITCRTPMTSLRDSFALRVGNVHCEPVPNPHENPSRHR